MPKHKQDSYFTHPHTNSDYNLIKSNKHGKNSWPIKQLNKRWLKLYAWTPSN